MEKIKVAIVEDNEMIQEYVKDILDKQDYIVHKYKSGEDFYKKIMDINYKLIILDVNLPGQSGFEICSKIKGNSNFFGNPFVVILTEITMQKDINRGLEIGADDYIKKPFDEIEFILRINKLLRMNFKDVGGEEKYQGLIFDFKQCIVKNNDEIIQLTKKESEILEYLFVNKGIIISKEKIYLDVWNDEYSYGNKNIEVFLGKIKKKIPLLKDKIENFKNIGYRLKN